MSISVRLHGDLLPIGNLLVSLLTPFTVSYYN